MKTAKIGDITVAYDDEGAGQALLLVHGHPFDRTMWRPQIERFGLRGHSGVARPPGARRAGGSPRNPGATSQRWRVIAPDLRGYGHTSVVPGKTLLGTFADDLARLLDHLQVDSAVIAGLSMGGQIVMEFHRRFPERVRGLVLADTSPLAETPDGRRARNELADRLLREGMDRHAVEVLPRMMAPANIDGQPDVAAHVLGMMRRTPAASAAAALRGRAERPDYTAELRRVTVPVLVVVGSEDDFTPVGDAELIRDLIPGATLAVVDGAGHLPNLERPEAFDAALAAFLERPPADLQRNCSGPGEAVAARS
jgi:pimeloyl-ACP methyl ester carboxylesterase